MFVPEYIQCDSCQYSFLPCDDNDSEETCLDCQKRIAKEELQIFESEE